MSREAPVGNLTQRTRCCQTRTPAAKELHVTTADARRVLVVEDDPVIAMVIEDILRDMGHEVAINLTLAQALLEIETREVDAVLLDMHLRGESARPMVLALIERKLPFAVLSGSDQSALQQQFPQIRLLPKPFGKAQLEQVVRELMNSAIGPSG